MGHPVHGRGWPVGGGRGIGMRQLSPKKITHPALALKLGAPLNIWEARNLCGFLISYTSTNLYFHMVFLFAIQQ
jgi:hypothetical protein